MTGEPHGPSDESEALPNSSDPTRLDDPPWKPLAGADGWEIAHRGAGRYLVRRPDGVLLNGLDTLWTRAICRFHARTLEMSDEEQASLWVRVTWIGLDRGWSQDQLRQEAAEVLGRDEPVEIETLPEDDLLTLIDEWEIIYANGEG